MEITHQPTKQEKFIYQVNVSRDTYSGYNKINTTAKCLQLDIIITRTKELNDKFNAYLEGKVLKNKLDKNKTTYLGNGLWNGLGYKTKKEWEKLINSYETIGQLERDFML